MPTCAIDGCASPAACRGWCDMHYKRWKRYRDPLAVRHATAPQGAIDGERWRLIPSHPDYEASTEGRIRRRTPGHVRGAGWVIQQRRQPNGYMSVGLYGRGQRLLVHRLVCEAFHGAATAPEVNHRDGDKQNNHPGNLEWVTTSENARHAFATGLRMMDAAHARRAANIRWKGAA